MAIGRWGTIDLGGTIGVLSGPAPLRLAYWAEADAHRGTVILVQGLGEFIEVYAETISDLRRMGFAVVAFDLRAQGGSERRVSQAIHIRTFNDYVDDLASVVAFAAAKNMPRPFSILGHSTGGLVSLLTADRIVGTVERMVLTAPFLKVAQLPVPGGLAALVCTGLCLVGQSRRAVAATRRTPRVLDGNRLTRDAQRYEELLALTDANPDLASGPPSFGWVRQAFKAHRKVAALKGRSLPIPTLFLAAGRDKIVSTPAIDGFVRAVANGGLIHFGEAEHHILLETDAVRAGALAALSAFLANAESGAAAQPSRRERRPSRAFKPTPASEAGAVARRRTAADADRPALDESTPPQPAEPSLGPTPKPAFVAGSAVTTTATLDDQLNDNERPKPTLPAMKRTHTNRLRRRRLAGRTSNADANASTNVNADPSSQNVSVASAATALSAINRSETEDRADDDTAAYGWLGSGAADADIMTDARDRETERAFDQRGINQQILDDDAIEKAIAAKKAVQAAQNGEPATSVFNYDELDDRSDPSYSVEKHQPGGSSAMLPQGASAEGEEGTDEIDWVDGIVEATETDEPDPPVVTAVQPKQAPADELSAAGREDMTAKSRKRRAGGTAWRKIRAQRRAKRH